MSILFFSSFLVFLFVQRSNWYALNSQEIRRTTSWETIKGWVDTSIADKTLLILATHDVSPNQTAYQYPFGCTPKTLTQLLDYLVQKQNDGQLKVMTVAEAYDYWNTAQQQPKPTVVVTFSDNHETDYTVAYPLFKARNLEGTSYIITSLMGLSGYLTWDEIAKMRAPVTVAPEFPTMASNVLVLAVLALCLLFFKRSHGARFRDGLI